MGMSYIPQVRESFMRQFVCEVEGEEEPGAASGGDVSRRAFEYIGVAKIAFPYRKRCLVKTLVVAPPSQRPSSALRRHVVSSIIELVEHTLPNYRWACMTFIAVIALS